MKNNKYLRIATFAATVGLLAASGCSSLGMGGKQGSDLAATGPSIIEAKSQPGTIELNPQLQPTQNAQVVADVKDFTAPITNVRLRFQHVPITLDMQNKAGSTWTAQLNPDQIKSLAVSGQTMNYQATVVATDSQGNSVTSKPLNIAIKAPEASQMSASAN